MGAQREPKTRAEVVDGIASGRLAATFCLVAQRFRTVEAANTEEGGWVLARHLEVFLSQKLPKKRWRRDRGTRAPRSRKQRQRSSRSRTAKKGGQQSEVAKRHNDQGLRGLAVAAGSTESRHKGLRLRECTTRETARASKRLSVEAGGFATIEGLANGQEKKRPCSGVVAPSRQGKTL